MIAKLMGPGKNKPRVASTPPQGLALPPSVVRAVAAVVFCMVIGCGNSNEPKPTPPPPLQVYVVQAKRGDLALFVEPVAILDGYVTADIRARVRGYLRTQNVNDGAAVKAGQVLFTIERSDYAAATAAAKADLLRARATEDHDRAELARNRNLHKEGVVSQQDVEDSSASVKESIAQVQAASAELERAALNLSYTTVRSPISGLAGIAQVRIGNLVGQDGPTLLLTVSQVDPMRVTFPLSELDYVRHPERFKNLEARDLAWARRQFEKLKADRRDENGDPGIELVLFGDTVYPHRGVVVATNRQIDPSTGTIQLQALVPNPDGLLRPGQYGRVRLQQHEEGRAALAIPEKALISVQGTYSLAVVKPDNKVDLRRVEVGSSVNGLKIIRSGLKEGERVVVEGVQKVANGAVVNPVPAPKDARAPAPSSQPPAKK